MRTIRATPLPPQPLTQFSMRTSAHFFGILLGFGSMVLARAADLPAAALESQFNQKVQPFLTTYCVTCHGGKTPEAEFDMSAMTTMSALLKDGARWSTMLERMATEEMPPADAKRQPSAAARQEAVAWFRAVQQDQISRYAGDPGNVLARRLSNAEFDYSVRDLTGADIKPAREFPVDPSNMAGFDNSGESLTMSPALLNKYLQATREVASHLYLREQGFGFAPHPMISESDRDKFCVQQIIDFYRRQNIDYADYFQAAWRFQHRAALGRPNQTLADCARENHVSEKYLATIQSVLTQPEEVGPLAKLQSLWRALPAPQPGNASSPRADCEAMRAYVVDVRKKVERRFLNLNAGEPGTEWLPFLNWKNEQYAKNRRTFDPEQLQVKDEPPRPSVGRVRVEGGNQFGPGQTILVKNPPDDRDLFVPAGERARYEAAWTRFASVFPDMFYREERGRNYFYTGRDEARFLSAGYHNVLGYFRDDWPLYELLLDAQQQATLDEMWRGFDFIAGANSRGFVQFAVSGTRGARESFRDKEPGISFDTHINDVQIASTPVLRKLEADYLARVTNGDDEAIAAIKHYFDLTDTGIRWVERTRVTAEPSHLDALLDFAARAYRRPLDAEEREDLLGFYRMARERNGLDHETALRESVVLILLSPNFNYRADLARDGTGIQPMSDYDLASRLSYFLWSSVPDAELLAHATRGDLYQPAVIEAQALRMLHDPRSRALAVEFGGNWLEFRRFEETNTVDLERYPVFTPELRQAMFEEPVRFAADVFQHNRSVLDFLFARDTFVNPVLAKHYGIRGVAAAPDEWVRIADATPYGRGGLLPMAVFLTKNAPGLRTSPVKRGYWVAKAILGDRIPPPPPTVPQLPQDETKLELPLREMLARHRADPACAGCHARFDSFGLVFEGFDPVGLARQKDLAGRTVEIHATFPGGAEGAGVEGLRRYLREKRQDDFTDNLCRKLLAYALGRSLILTDGPLVQEMRQRLAADGYRSENLIKSIVTSPQFLTKRGRETLASQSP